MSHEIPTSKCHPRFYQCYKESKDLHPKVTIADQIRARAHWTLVLLVSRAGKLVTRDEIRDEP